MLPSFLRPAKAFTVHWICFKSWPRLLDSTCYPSLGGKTALKQISDVSLRSSSSSLSKPGQATEGS